MTNLPAQAHAPVQASVPTSVCSGGLRTADLQRIAAAIDAEVAQSTRTTYASGWRSWESWCRRRGLTPLPAEPDALAAHLTERAEAGPCNGTLDGDSAAIAHRHHQESLGDPTAAAVVRRVRRGLRRILGTAPRRQAHPLTVAELTQIVASIDPASRIGIRDRAVFLLGYAAALRPSEIAALHLADIGVYPHGLPVTIRRSRTDQEGLGQMVGVAAGVHAATDPIRALRSWLDIRPVGPGPFFARVPAARPVSGDGIGQRTVSDLVRNRATAAGLGRPRRQRSLAARRARNHGRRQRSSDRPDRRPDPTPRPDHPVQSLHPTCRCARQHHQPRPRTVTARRLLNAAM